MADKGLAAKLPSSDGDGVPAQQRGLKRGSNPGPHPRSGRKPNTYKKFLAHLLASEKHRKEFAAATQDRADPNFMAATKHAAAYAEGVPAQSVELTGKDGAPFTVRLVRE